MTAKLPGIAAATQAAAGGTRSDYGGIARTLHWTTVGLVIWQFGSSQIWGGLPRAARHLAIVSHMSLGIVLAAVVAFRLAWRLMPAHRVSDLATGWVRVASKAVHYLLYGLLAAAAVLGFLLRWSGGEAMSLFGLLLPAPFAPFSRDAHRLVGEAHEWVGWAIVVLAAGHALAALYHHFVLHDDVLWRMLPGRRARRMTEAAPPPPTDPV